MPFSRYNKSEDFFITDPSYEEYVGKKKLNFIKSIDFQKFKYPTVEQISQLTIASHIWSTSDKFFKLSEKYYKSPSYWWIIPYYNMRYLESDFTPGTIVYIPLPLEKFINFVGL